MHLLLTGEKIIVSSPHCHKFMVDSMITEGRPLRKGSISRIHEEL
jgi:hypothetical protein